VGDGLQLSIDSAVVVGEKLNFCYMEANNEALSAEVPGREIFSDCRNEGD
jgi:hypothetical protein